MNKYDVLLTLIFMGMIILFSICFVVCINQMFLDVELWVKVVACIGSHFALLCDVATICVFVSLIDWEN